MRDDRFQHGAAFDGLPRRRQFDQRNTSIDAHCCHTEIVDGKKDTDDHHVAVGAGGDAGDVLRAGPAHAER